MSDCSYPNSNKNEHTKKSHFYTNEKFAERRRGTQAQGDNSKIVYLCLSVFLWKGLNHSEDDFQLTINTPRNLGVWFEKLQ